MPQMSPMHWCFLFFFFLLVIILIMTFIYFSLMKIPKMDLINNSNNLYNWSW
uniref:ATP synthase F0 subunit 8 n=2 Tax=Magicicada tredecim TaxID=52805 RepID=A0A3Q8GBA1_9HEMI|nr:ATP synthase F0 subunit 8 [Magicicada tredecim]AWV83539.1 ATP synthase F0 subunit 8 [Magicicada tredecim]AWV83552.1 ATP synthase F0 subunit 8 [Magicicada tredecim]AWV83565.1 ATP synthase F0 subunit 8 [Magicicada tredecim]AWV83578.1 ATP synthase F0 subunit 8 [Magicicada tredecim]AWV83591.1 ATP synthase F0 subunit 8 [Magicicada tredecim]